MIRVNRLFYDDHTESRDLPAPPVLRENRTHYWIDPTHHDAAELLNDADYYSTEDLFPLEGDPELRRLINGAKQTRRALRKAGTPDNPCSYGVLGGWCDHPQCPKKKARLDRIVEARVIEAKKKGRYPKTQWWTPDLVE
jgi:hypothetical protein